MSIKVVSDEGRSFIAGNHNEQFTFTTNKSVKLGQTFTGDDGKVLGLVVNDVDVDTDAQETRPVSVLVSGVVYLERITGVDGTKAPTAQEQAALNALGVHFLGQGVAIATTGTSSSTASSATTGA